MISRLNRTIRLVAAGLVVCGSLSAAAAITGATKVQKNLPPKKAASPQAAASPGVVPATKAAATKAAATKAAATKAAATKAAATKTAASKTVAPQKTPAAKKTGLVVIGTKIYGTNGCAGCHAIAGAGGNAGPDLTNTGSEPSHTLKWFEDQVVNPKIHTPGSTMPAFPQIKGNDLVALATYLVSLKAPEETAPVTHSATAAVAPPNPAIVTEVEKKGGAVRQVAQNDNHLDVSFHMQGASATDASLEPLGKLKNVTELDLGQTGITDAGLEHIKGLNDLTALHLEGTKITDKGLAYLKNMRNLAYLNLYNTGITDAGLEQLAGLSNLKHLYLWETRVTPDGINKLKKALPQIDIVGGWDQPAKK